MLMKSKWDVFVSHASEDKDAVAEPLARALVKTGLRVWYDRIELQLGDSLRQRIDEGLAHSHFGIVVLSRSFFAKHWPQQELNGLAQREEAASKVILPVWHDITVEQVRRHSPILADRLAAHWSDGIDAVVSQIWAVVRRSGSGAKARKLSRPAGAVAPTVRRLDVPGGPPRF